MLAGMDLTDFHDTSTAPVHEPEKTIRSGIYQILNSFRQPALFISRSIVVKCMDTDISDLTK